MFVEEQIAIPCGSLRLSGVLGYPESGAPAYAVLLCPPHPNFAGDMENNVILALAREFSRDAVTLRFNYRGIGQSEIALPDKLSIYDFWNDIEEAKDYAAPLADVHAAAAELSRISRGAPLVIVGYSFGAIVGLSAGRALSGAAALAGIAPPLIRYDFSFIAGFAKPCLLLSGSGDFVYSPEARAKLALPPSVQHDILDGQDHFFRGHEDALAARVRRFVNEAIPAKPAGGK